LGAAGLKRGGGHVPPPVRPAAPPDARLTGTSTSTASQQQPLDLSPRDAAADTGVDPPARRTGPIS